MAKLAEKRIRSVLRSCSRSRKTRIVQFTLPAISSILTSEQIGQPAILIQSLLRGICCPHQSTVASIEQFSYSNCDRLIHNHLSLCLKSSTALPGYSITLNYLVLATITRHVRPTTAHMLLACSNILSLDVLAGLSRPHVQLLVRTERRRTVHRQRATSLPTPPPLSNLATSKDAAAARDWLMRFRACPIPRVAVDIAFSRSSGPGGQVCLFLHTLFFLLWRIEQ